MILTYLHIHTNTLQWNDTRYYSGDMCYNNQINIQSQTITICIQKHILRQKNITDK